MLTKYVLTKYKNAIITTSEAVDGWQYHIKLFDTFEAKHSRFVGEESALESAKLLIDILLEEIEW